MIKFLALGDSYTIGTGVAASDRWPIVLAQQLEVRQGIRVNTLEIVAQNGWRTDNLAIGIKTNELHKSYDLVSLLIGVNDQYQGFSVAGYADRLRHLVNIASKLTGKGRLFVISIPDYAYTPLGNGDPKISQEVTAFNQTARQVASSEGIPFFDITFISRDGLDHPDLVATDALHPSGKQYRRWVDEVLLPKVSKMLTH